MPPHTWSWLGETVSDSTHRMFYRGEEIKEAYYRGEKVWGDDDGDDVRFIDWDGTVLHQMSAEAFLRLSDWPIEIHPSKDTDEDEEWGLHVHLLDDGWNWDFEAAQSFVRRYRYLDIGAEYATENDAVVVRVEIPNDGANQNIQFRRISSSTMDIHWGDGTETLASTGASGAASIFHTYEKAGRYVIKIAPTSAGMKALYGNFEAITVYTTRRYLKTLEGLYGANQTHNVISVYYGKSAEISWGFCYNSYAQFVGFSKEVTMTNSAVGLWLDSDYAGTLIIPRATTYFNNSAFYRYASDINLYWNGGTGITNSAFCKGIIYPDTWTGTNDLIRNAAFIERYIIPPHCVEDIALRYIPTPNLKKIVLPSQDEFGTNLEVTMPSAGPSNEETRIYVEQPYEDYWKVKIGANTDWYQRIEVVKPVK